MERMYCSEKEGSFRTDEDDPRNEGRRLANPRAAGGRENLRDARWYLPPVDVKTRRYKLPCEVDAMKSCDCVLAELADKAKGRHTHINAKKVCNMLVPLQVQVKGGKVVASSQTDANAFPESYLPRMRDKDETWLLRDSLRHKRVEWWVERVCLWWAEEDVTGWSSFDSLTSCERTYRRGQCATNLGMLPYEAGFGRCYYCKSGRCINASHVRRLVKV
jgi:hypothetical protein